MANISRTVRQIGKDVGLEGADLEKKLRDVLSLSKPQSQDGKHSLRPDQVRRFYEAVGHRPTKEDEEVADDGPADVAEDDLAGDEFTPEPDPITSLYALQPRDLTHPILLHDGVAKHLEELSDLQLSKRVGLVVQHLAAHGRTSVVKGCSDEDNRGWSRSPLGGNGGNQYYLWWARQGTRQTKDLALAPNAVVVRDIRHHDNHNPLRVGDIDAFLPLERSADLRDDAFVSQPWTEKQAAFVASSSPVRIIRGRPGSGKTTVLWRAVDLRGGSSGLYVTWSSELTHLADEHFRAFAAGDSRIESLDFGALLGKLTGTDLKPKSLGDSTAAFIRDIERLAPRKLGPWANRKTALFAEIRASLVGTALFDSTSVQSGDGLVRRPDLWYEAHGETRIDRDAIEALLSAVAHLERGDGLAPYFPELCAAQRATKLLVDCPLPEGFETFDRLIVDEVQDLTLGESDVLLQLALAIGRAREASPPNVMIAGDDGQTVRPTAFDWGTFKGLVQRRIGRAEDFKLDEDLRCPRHISEIVERAGENYGGIRKGARPTGQLRTVSGHHTNADVYYATITSETELHEFTSELEGIDGIAFIHLDDDVPSWIPSALAEQIDSPSSAKGREFQAVCILDLAKTLDSLRPETADHLAAKLEESARRTAIDRLRVSLSRATEKLAVVDYRPERTAQTATERLLGAFSPCDAGDVIGELSNNDISPEERTSIRIRDAREQIDERPRRAWRRAQQARRGLGEDPNVPGAVGDEILRREAHEVLLATAARLFVDGIPEGVRSEDVLAEAKSCATQFRDAAAERAIETLAKYADAKVHALVVLEAAAQLDASAWLDTALRRRAQALSAGIRAGASDLDHCERFSGEVEQWLNTVRFFGSVQDEARDLRCRAFDTLLANGRYDSATDVLARIQPEDPARHGQLCEARRQHHDAATWFERAGDTPSALRNWRSAGNPRKAIAYAPQRSQEEADLQWILDVQALMERRPNGHRARLTDAEKQLTESLARKANS